MSMKAEFRSSQSIQKTRTTVQSDSPAQEALRGKIDGLLTELGDILAAAVQGGDTVMASTLAGVQRDYRAALKKGGDLKALAKRLTEDVSYLLELGRYAEAGVGVSGSKKKTKATIAGPDIREQAKGGAAASKFLINRGS